VGIYSATYQLASYPISLISSMIVMAAFPIIINTWEKNGENITRELISKVTRYYLLLAIPLLAGSIALSDEIILILGASFFLGHTVLPWVCFGVLMLGLCVYVNKGLELKKKTRVLSFLVGIAGISNIAMNLLLVPRYGFYGAGVATGLACSIYFISSVIVSKKYLKWTVDISSVKNALIGSIVMGIAVVMVKWYLIRKLSDLSNIQMILMRLLFSRLLCHPQISLGNCSKKV
jgi:O-antigen/teichoic acid export membrane protein